MAKLDLKSDDAKVMSHEGLSCLHGLTLMQVRDLLIAQPHTDAGKGFTVCTAPSTNAKLVCCYIILVTHSYGSSLIERFCKIP